MQAALSLKHNVRIIVVCALVAIAGAAHAQNLVVNGSFEKTSPLVAPNGFNNGLSPITGVPGWTTTATLANFFEVWSNTTGGIPASSGTNQLEINAQSGDQTVSQVVTNLTPGCLATFCFDYTGRNAPAGSPLTPNNDFTVSLSGGFSLGPMALNPPAYSAAALGWQHFCTNFIPTTSTITITFRGHPHVNVASGAHIDNVTLTSGPPPVITCPATLTTNISGSSVVVKFADPIVTGGALERCVPPSGSVFALGTTHVICTATNACGTSTCTFDVTVVNRDPAAAPCDHTNKGKNFWLAFPGNYAPDPANQPKITLCIVGPAGTTGLVGIPGLPVPFSTSFTIPPPAVGTIGSITIMLPSAADLGSVSDQVVAKGVNVSASNEVAVFGMNRVKFTTDSFLALPRNSLGQEYIVAGYKNVQAAMNLIGTQFAVVACEANTLVTIVPSVTTGLHPGGVPYNITLEQGEAYQLRNTSAGADLSGTIITATKPVAVFGGHSCANIESSTTFFCDTLLEQLLPVALWGTEFATVPLATRSKYVVRVVAASDDTHVQMNSTPAVTPSAVTLNRGALFEWVIAGPARVTADKPVFVAEFSGSSDMDGVVSSDPFLVTIPSVTLFQKNYTFCVPENDFPINYANIVVDTAGGTAPDLRLDGTSTTALLTPYPTSAGASLAWLQLPLSPGLHTLSAAKPFTAIVYGFAQYDSYAHLAGMGPGCTKECLSISCPTNIFVSSNDGIGQRVNFQVFATNSCGGKAVVNCKPESGSLFPFGTTVVNCVASDTAGGTASCSFTVTVLAPPVVITTSSATATATATITLVWAPGGKLQAADDLISPFTNIPNAKSPYVVQTAGPGAAQQQFYRVVYGAP